MTTSPEVAGVEELMTYSRRSLAETVRASMAQVVLLQQELAASQWNAGLLAAQRQSLLDFLAEAEHPCSEVVLCYVCRLSDQVYSRLITDPRDVPTGPTKESGNDE